MVHDPITLALMSVLQETPMQNKTILLLCALGTLFITTYAGDGLNSQVRFKVLKSERKASVDRFTRITRDQFNVEDVQTVTYEEKDTGFAITDSYKISPRFDLFATAEYSGQYQTNIQLTNGDHYEISESLLFGYLGLMYEKNFGKKLSAFGLLGYGYYRDRIRAYDLAQAELDPPGETLYHTGNYEGFAPAYEIGLTWHFNEFLGLSFSYESTEINDVKQTATIASFSINY